MERGSNILIPLMGFQRDPKYYPDPESFNPDRFLPVNNKSFTDMPYLPFGDGPRNCIGSRMGKMQTKVGLVKLLQKFNFHLAGNTLKDLKMAQTGVILQPIGGIELKVSKRIV